MHPAIRLSESGGKLLLGGEAGKVRPKVDLHVARRERTAPLRPVDEPASGAIAFGVEPPLIPAHDFAFERSAVDSLHRRPGIRPQRFRLDGLTSQRRGLRKNRRPSAGSDDGKEELFQNRFAWKNSPLPARKWIRFSVAIIAWRGTLSNVREPMCGVTVAFGCLSSGWSAGGGS